MKHGNVPEILIEVGSGRYNFCEVMSCMIPIKLELKNFLSYGDQTVKVDFDDHSLICLSGKNGNGKSALLDAITWVLWGQARKVSGTAKADTGLIRLGQSRMVVSMDFLCNDQKYRVRREYAITYGKPVTLLSIDYFHEASQSYRSLSEKTIRQTQEKIEKVVGLDFDTFVNSAFLRQGQSNEFSQKTPKERKQILANILSLSRYDELYKRSLEYLRKQTENCKLLEKIQEQVVLELEQEQECIIHMQTHEKELALLDEKLEGLGTSTEKVEKKKNEWLQKKYHYDQNTQSLIKLEESFVLKKKIFFENASLWRTVHGASLSSPDLDMLDQERKSFLAEEKVLRDKQQEEIFLQEKVVATKELHQKKVHDLMVARQEELSKQKLLLDSAEFSHKQLLATIAQREDVFSKSKEKQTKIAQELKGIVKEREELLPVQATLDAVKVQFEKRRIFYQTMVERGNWAKRELSELDRKKEIVHDKQNPSCPLCEQVLTIKRKQFLATTLTVQEDFLHHRLTRITKILKTLKVILFEQHKEMQKLSFSVDRVKQLEINITTLQKALDELTSDDKKISLEMELLFMRKAKEQKELDVLAQKFAKKEKEAICDSHIVELESELASLEAQKKAVGYDKKKHEKIASDLAACEKKALLFQELKTKKVEQQETRSKLLMLYKEIKEIKRDRAALLAQQKSFDVLLGKNFDDQLAQIKEQQKESLKIKETYLQEKGKLENKKTRFAALNLEQQKRDREIEAIKNEIKEYQLLAQMFGKDGIQALLIEQAIPEIEQEANVLLSRLTDNQSQIFIESLRDLKSGGVRESLDIHISDASGIRPYEMFSGGEAFRIDFALRIAISKLLARRAGTALQTLIIDEGFGSQDEDGLQRLMDAIYAIQKDFVKIIVVSHLAAFKNNFPVHFIVEKDSLGSTIRVEERG